MVDFTKRKRLRLAEYDYKKYGCYFVTICVKGGKLLFGNVVDNQMVLNEAGIMIKRVWQQIPEYYSGVDIDDFIVMPNHIHGIIRLRAVAGPRAGQHFVHDPVCQEMIPGPIVGENVLLSLGKGRPQGAARADKRFSLSDIVHRFKSLSTSLYIHGVKESGWEPFVGQLWLRSFHDWVVRQAGGLIQVREYIRDNPRLWASDEENPERAEIIKKARPK